MTIAPDSVSYPTLAVIEAHGITDPAERRLIWEWSGMIADGLWDREFNLDDVGRFYLGHSLTQTFGHRLPVIRDHLQANLRRAVQWCKDNANG